MNEDKNLTNHDYDGIQEYDNSLPNWWLATLWITIFFGIGYWGYFHSTEKGATSAERFTSAENARQEKLAALQKDKPALSNETLISLSKDTAALKEGENIFKTNCSACHGANGEGLIGPSLIDAETIYGATGMDVFTSVMDGRIRDGNVMPPWKDVLGETKASQVTAYVLSLSK